jgi:hypothetical protein
MARSIKDLYAYALAEGEGVGTAYEYYVKRAVMAPLLDTLPPRARVLVAGLPEKYGVSLDFLLAAWERKARAIVVDERPAAIERARRAIDRARDEGKLGGIDLRLEVVPSVLELAGLGACDLVLSCEVMQRIPADRRRAYVQAIRGVAPAGLVFVPNSENSSHLAISGLAGLDRRSMAEAFDGAADRVGFVDLPPFPPGIKRSEDQRARASTGTVEALAMRALEGYALAERLLPVVIKRRVAHIVYATWGDSRDGASRRHRAR